MYVKLTFLTLHVPLYALHQLHTEFPTQVYRFVCYSAWNLLKSKDLIIP